MHGVNLLIRTHAGPILKRQLALDYMNEFLLCVVAGRALLPFQLPMLASLSASFLHPMISMLIQGLAVNINELPFLGMRIPIVSFSVNGNTYLPPL
jgi:hypothetical protein